MRNVTAAQQATDWVNGMAQGGARWQAGCAGTSKNLFQNALAKSAIAAQNYTRSVQPGGAWNNAMQQGSMDNWKTACRDPQAVSRFQNPKASSKQYYATFAAKARSIAYPQMKAAAEAQTTPQTKVVAALNVLIGLGRKNGGNQLSGRNA
jgi:hypothetical protein